MIARLGGFSLLEVSLCILVGSIMLSVLLRLSLAIWMNSKIFSETVETDAMWRNLNRVISSDAHSATTAELLFGSLSMTLVDGTKYRYILNPQGQLIRNRIGGGSAVVAQDIRTVSAVAVPSGIQFTVTFRDGTAQTLDVCTMEGMS